MLLMETAMVTAAARKKRKRRRRGPGVRPPSPSAAGPSSRRIVALAVSQTVTSRWDKRIRRLFRYAMQLLCPRFSFSFRFLFFFFVFFAQGNTPVYLPFLRV